MNNIPQSPSAIKRRWPTEKCEKKNQAHNTRLDLENVIGVFIMWASIVALSFVVIILQFQWRKIKIRFLAARGRIQTTNVEPHKQTKNAKEKTLTGDGKKQAWLDQV